MSFEEQIMSKDKCSSIFSRQEIKAVLFIALQIFFRSRRGFENNWGISLRYYPVLPEEYSVP